MAKRNYSSKRRTKSKIKRALKRPIKRTLSRLSEKSPVVEKEYRKLRVKLRRGRFERTLNIPVNEKMVLFESFMGRKYADSPKAIYEYMLENPEYKDYEFVWFFKDRCMDEYLFLEKNERTKLILWGGPEYYKYYAQGKYWFTNSRIISAISPKENQVYVQCWHGTPLKRLGFDIKVDASDAKNDAEATREMYEEDARKYTYMISPSAYCSEKFISAFNLKALGKENIMIEEGYPRNDVLTNTTQEYTTEIREKLSIPEGKKVILYAPTWRDNQHTRGVGYVYEAPIDFNRLKKTIGDEYVILFRAHYFIDNAFDFSKDEGFVIDVCDYPEINDLYIVSDILITDYSSVFFDYGILKRPIIFYMYDLDYYKDELRGFYIDISELPGPIIKTQHELEEKIDTIELWTSTGEYKKKYERFTSKFTYLDDGHATERVTKRIIKTNK